MTKVLNGKKIANQILKDLKQKVKKTSLKPGLAVILVGNNPASVTYVGLKEKASRETGIYFEKFIFPAKAGEIEIIAKIKTLNQDKKIHGILVQLPLPKSLNENKIIKAIDPKKDVDGFHPQNLKKVVKNQPFVTSPTLNGIIRLLKESKLNPRNKKALILAKSPIFIKPLIKQLEDNGLTVSHNNKILKSEIKNCDILIVALGKPHIIKKEMVREKSIIIDIGFTKRGKKVIGDVGPEVKSIVAAFTPVPGGVGPLTVAYLLKNTYKLSKL